MYDLQESPQEIDRQLAAARKALQEFEEGVDRKRLIRRLRTASPANPVLLIRFLFGAIGVLAVIASIGVLAIAQIDSNIARVLAKFEMVNPLPAEIPLLEEIPLLPALLGLLAGFMFLAWLTATMAAWNLGRDAPLLPWEQKQHQKLLNEVTRLTTQKAVTERIRNTPAGARPRIATPVPAGMRRTEPAPPPSGAALSRAGLGYTPGRVPSSPPAPSRTVSQMSAPPSPTPRGTPGGIGLSRQARSLSPESARSEAVRPEPARPEPARPEPARPEPAQTSASPRSLPPFGPASDTSQHGSSGLRFARGPSADSGMRAPPPASADEEIRANEPLPMGPDTSAVRTAGPGRVDPNSLTQPMKRPATSLRPPPDPPNTRPGRTPIPTAGRTGRPAVTRPEPPRPSSVSGREALPTAPSPQDTPSGERPAIVLPPLANGGGLPSHLDTAQVSDDATTVEHDDLVSDDMDANGAPNRARPQNGALDDRVSGLRSFERDAPVVKPADGILAQARSGTNISRPTPFGSAGRIKLPAPAILRVGNAPMPMGQSTRGGTPLGAPPKAGLPVGQAVPRLSVPPQSTPEREVPTASVQATVELYDDAPLEEMDTGTIDLPEIEAVAEAIVMFEEDELTSAEPTEDEPWLRDALEKSEALDRALPPEATLALSREPHLPFTLVISAAPPAVAVRAMVNFIEFLADIATPPRARIELVGLSSLDRSFHKNVEAALGPHFGSDVEVSADRGRVDIRFTNPDPAWGAHPRLTM